MIVVVVVHQGVRLAVARPDSGAHALEARRGGRVTARLGGGGGGAARLSGSGGGAARRRGGGRRLTARRGGGGGLTAGGGCGEARCGSSSVAVTSTRQAAAHRASCSGVSDNHVLGLEDGGL